ncbi:MAG: hypothetical protein ACJ77N_10460 [Chloroflexota bacterium]|jgi:hypothetical protein
MDLRTRRIYEARRAALIGRLEGQGLARADAERGCDAWELEADRRGFSRLSPSFWSDAFDWIKDGGQRHSSPTERNG